MNIALVADSHLSDRAPESVANWHAAARSVAALEPDLTIHLGDITLDGENRPDEIPFAAEHIRSWPTPMRCVFGNHDMGTGSGEEPLSATALQQCIASIGPDHWHMSVRGWTLLGLNAQLLGSGTAEEMLQHAWLQAIASHLTSEDRVALFLHRPVRRPQHDTGMPIGRYVPDQASRWLLEGPLRRSLHVVLSGHTHQALDFVAAGVRHIWVPSASFVIADALQERVGQKTVGLGWLSLSPGALGYFQVTPPRIAHA